LNALFTENFVRTNAHGVQERIQHKRTDTPMADAHPTQENKTLMHTATAKTEPSTNSKQHFKAPH